MAVLIEATSVVIRTDVLMEKFSNDWARFKSMVPNQTLCADEELVRVGFMYPVDVKDFIEKLEAEGFVHLNGKVSVDIVVIDQLLGPLSACDWVEFRHVELDESGSRIAAAQLVGSKLGQVITPEDWEFEHSLSSSYRYSPQEAKGKGLTYMRSEDGYDVYRSDIDEKEVYTGRTAAHKGREIPS